MKPRKALILSPKATAAIQAYLGLAGTNEIAVGVLRDGVGYYTSDGVSETARFDIGSISKTFTAQLILGLVCDGKLSLDTTVDAYLPLRAGRYPTIAQLLTHTAGYHHLTPIEITVPKLLTKRYAVKNPYRGANTARVLAALSRRNHTKPRNPYGYSDFSYAILAAVAERVTGQPFSELLHHLIREEYGLQSTEAYPTAPRIPVYLGGRPLKAWHWDKHNPYIAGGGVVSTLEDMLRYAAIQLEATTPSVLASQRLHPPSFSPKSNIGTCLGWHTYKKSDQLWHVGGVGTFRASMIVNRRLGCAVVVLGNAKGKRSANVHYIAKLLYSELKKKRVVLTTEHDRSRTV